MVYKKLVGLFDIRLKEVESSIFSIKDIFEVMKLQKDLVEVKHHLKPLINIKG